MGITVGWMSRPIWLAWLIHNLRSAESIAPNPLISAGEAR